MKVLSPYEVVPFAKGTEIDTNLHTEFRTRPYEVVPFAKGTEIPCAGAPLLRKRHIWNLRSCPLREGD